MKGLLRNTNEGRVWSMLLNCGRSTTSEILEYMRLSAAELNAALVKLQTEGFVVCENGWWEATVPKQEKSL